MTSIETFGEDRAAAAIENQCSKIPSIGYLGLALASMVGSASLVLANKKDLGNFIGLWAPSILIIGLYNELLKIEKEMASSKDKK